MWGRLSRGKLFLEDWARENSLELVDQQYKWFSRGPFRWTTGNNQNVYQITVRDEYSNLRSGWARVGSRWWGMWERKVEVRWDDEGKEKRKGKLKNG
jgi:hypothetical protein